MTLGRLLDLILFLGELYAYHTRYTGDEKIISEAKAALDLYRAHRGTLQTKAEHDALELNLWPAPPPAPSPTS